MIVTRLKLPLEQAEYSALLKAAEDELRNPIDQARFILRREFERLGLLTIEARVDHHPAPTMLTQMQDVKKKQYIANQ